MKVLESPFNMKAILRSDERLYEVWKQRPFIFDLDAYGTLIVKMVIPDEMGVEIDWLNDTNPLPPLPSTSSSFPEPP